MRKRKKKLDNEDNSIKDNNVYTVVKNKFTKLLKDNNSLDLSKNEIIDKINDTVYRVNYIVYHTTNFLKLAILKKFSKDEDFKIDTKLVLAIMTNIVSKKSNTRGNHTLSDDNVFLSELVELYNIEYLPLINNDSIVTNEYLSFILPYEAGSYMTNLKNNIAMHFTKHLYKIVKVIFNYRSTIKKLSDKEHKKEFCKKVSTFYKDLLKINETEFISDIRYHCIIKQLKSAFIPIKEKYAENSINYDIKKNPILYLKHFYRMNCFIENATLFTEYNIKTDHVLDLFKLKINSALNIPINKDIKLFNILPLKRSLIPSYITIDTASLIMLFYNKGCGNYLSNINKYKNELWMNLFKTDTGMFKRTGFSFNYSIKTDGYGVSIIFGKYDHIVEEQLRKKKKDRILNQKEKVYIESLENIKEKLEGKNYVVIDPNKQDLIYCLDKEGNHFRYTNKQRKYETQSKRRTIKVEREKKSTLIENNNEIINYLKNKQEYNKRLIQNNIITEINNIASTLHDKFKITIKKILCSKKSKHNIITSVYKYIKTIKDSNDITNITAILDIYSNEINNNKNISYDSIEKTNTVSNLKSIINNYNTTLNKTIKYNSIKSVESILSKYNSKTNNIDEFKEYISGKDKVNDLITTFYKKEIHRKNKLDIYSNKIRSEMKMINNFKSKFGDSNNTVVIMGDWSQKHTLFGQEPTINKRFRYLFKKEKYELFMLDEFRTSKLCNKCECYVKNEYKRNITDKKSVWGLVCCKNKSCVQELKLKNNSLENLKYRYINRDKNSVLNMKKIVRNLIESNKRPVPYTRERCAV